MIIKATRTIFIEADSRSEFEEKLNENLKGINEPTIQIFGKYEGAIIYTERIYVEEEEAPKCDGKCGDCPFFTPPADGRVKWFKCEQAHRRVNKDSDSCSFFPTERRDEIVSNIGTETEGKEMEDGRPVIMPTDGMVEGLPQKERRHSIHGLGERHPVRRDGSACERTIQGGIKNVERDHHWSNEAVMGMGSFFGGHGRWNDSGGETWEGLISQPKSRPSIHIRHG